MSQYVESTKTGDTIWSAGAPVGCWSTRGKAKFAICLDKKPNPVFKMLKSVGTTAAGTGTTSAAGDPCHHEGPQGSHHVSPAVCQLD